MQNTFYPERYLVTAALPYANGPLHLGHLAGAYLSADAYVRFQRLMGKDIVFVCGSDEYGAAITIRARKEGVSPHEIVDKYHGLIKETFEKVGVSFDIYHRTSADIHAETSQEFFRTLYQKGEFEEIQSEQYYDVEANMFLADRYILGTCPNCGHPEAYGDQCENCGNSLSPNELIDPKSTISGSVPVMRSTKHWYLPLQKNEEWLRDWIKNGELDKTFHHDPNMWKKHVVGQCMSWLDGGLHPRSMTRDLDWGVDVPQEIEGSEGKKLYVWMDAPIGYISATKQWAKDNQKDWRDYWQKDDAALIHFIGKDNIVFHCVIFPAILKLHGDFNLPINVPANQFLNLEGRKLSTSKGWAVWVHEYIEDIPNRVDELRYSLYKNMPEQKDSEFTWKGWQEANNNELVNNLGNFVNRVLVLTNKYYNGVVPSFDPDIDFIGSEGPDMPTWHDSEMLTLFDKMDEYCQYVRQYDFRSALRSIMDISSAGNLILQQNEPWKLVKEDPETVKVVMNICMQYVTALSVIMEPFLPYTSKKLRNILGLEELKGKGELLDLLGLIAEGEMAIDLDHQIGKASHLFSRIDDDVVDQQIEKLKSRDAETKQVDEVKTETFQPEIQYEDFVKMDLRVAEITKAEKVAKADKLLKIELKVGSEERTVVSGIALQFKPEEIIGQKVTYLANLAPRKLRGVMSQGMILMAENGDGKLGFLAPPAHIPSGSKIS
ncbi:methionine--tRNA ligase [Membranihabitans marinus]|uniref:methionine--tRNA ligase n=1 Tax=Membranihabitans marinus TaxID=1227546 RepID=UPI001F0223FD|nr:methionine--tRNA ligase [Membranihabitans marinus]